MLTRDHLAGKDTASQEEWSPYLLVCCYSYRHETSSAGHFFDREQKPRLADAWLTFKSQARQPALDSLQFLFDGGEFARPANN
jgi:hypothetical protein